MKVSLEFYQVLVRITIILFILLVLSIPISILLKLGGTLANFIMIGLAPGCVFGALLVLTNIHRKEVIFTWKKKQTELHLPFGDFREVEVYDTEGNKYRVNLLFQPKLIENKNQTND